MLRENHSYNDHSEITEVNESMMQNKTNKQKTKPSPTDGNKLQKSEQKSATYFIRQSDPDIRPEANLRLNLQYNY